jgi:hypothetical protein
MPLASRCIAWWVLVAFTVAVIVYFGSNKNPRNALDNLFQKCSENKGKFWTVVITVNFKTIFQVLNFFPFFYKGTSNEDTNILCLWLKDSKILDLAGR